MFWLGGGSRWGDKGQEIADGVRAAVRRARGWDSDSQGRLLRSHGSVKTVTRAQHGATLRKEFQAEGPTSSGSHLRTSCRVCRAGRTGRKERRRKGQKGKQGSLLTCHSGAAGAVGKDLQPLPWNMSLSSILFLNPAPLSSFLLSLPASKPSAQACTHICSSHLLLAPRLANSSCSWL